MSKNFITNGSSFIPSKTGTPPRKRRVRPEYPWGKDEEVEILQDTIFGLEREVEDAYNSLRATEEYYEKLIAEMRAKNEHSSVQAQRSDTGYALTGEVRFDTVPPRIPRRSTTAQLTVDEAFYEYSSASVSLAERGSSGSSSGGTAT